MKLLCLVVVCVWILGCTNEPARDKAPASAASYVVKDKVMEVAKDRRAVTLDHGDIPGLMKGMKMSFQVDDSNVLEGIAPGDAVEGRLKVDGPNYIITHLKKR